MKSLHIVIERADGVPAYRQIYLQISDQIKSGALAAGAFLPKIRVLSQELGIARNTVEAAYKQLALEGYATGHRGRGYIVEALDLEPLASADADTAPVFPTDLSPTSPGRNPLGDALGCRYDFSYGNRSPEDFPMHLWRAHAEKVMTADYAQLAASYMDPFGLPALRQRIASYLGLTRNVSCTPDQVVLLPGTRPALKHISGLFPAEDRVVGMEEPGFDTATKVFADCGWDVRPIPRYKGERTYINSVIGSGARCLFCTPSNQFPLGRTLPISTRLELIGWAKRTDSFIIEDDYCCEYRYDGSSPIPSLQSLDADHVIYVGTLSKILTPAVRISYAVLPRELLGRWERMHDGYRCTIDWMSQAIIHSMMASGDWAKHVRTTTNLYQRRHAILMDAIHSELGDRVQLMGENAGLHMLVGDKAGRSQGELIRLAQAEGVRVYETDPYWMGAEHPMGNFVLLGFSAIPNEDIKPGIQALARAWYR